MSSLGAAQTFLLNNGRLLERHLFGYLFAPDSQPGSRDKVINALKAYQNEDGGFGNALEPDKRTSFSQPIDQESALKVMDEVGLNGEIVEGMCDFSHYDYDGRGRRPVHPAERTRRSSRPLVGYGRSRPARLTQPDGKHCGALAQAQLHAPLVGEGDNLLLGEIRGSR